MTTTMEILSGDAAVAESNQGGEAGYRRADFANPQARVRMVEARELWEAAMSGGLSARARLAEAMSTSDFPVLLGGAFERELLATYEDLPTIWQGFATRVTVRDFRAKTLVDLLGGKATLEPVAPGSPYPARGKSEASYSLTVAKRGGRFPLLWEDFINDDLDGFSRLPGDLAQAARDTEDYLATSLLVDAAGALTAFFTAGNKNAATALPLTTDNLGAAIGVINDRKDSEGRPVVTNNGLVLMVPPALEMTALAILNATQIETTVGSTKIVGPNYLKGKVTLVVNPWLTVISTDNKASTRWFLLPAPSNARPAVAVGFLRGHEVPDLRVKSSGGQRIGGGDVDPMDGSFEFDDVQFRARHVLGGTTLDPIATYVSNGS